MPKFSIVLVALGLLFSHTAIAQDAENSQEVIIPLFSQKLSFNLPDGWKTINQKVLRGVASVRFEKEARGEEGRKDIFRVIIYKNFAKKYSLEEMLTEALLLEDQNCVVAQKATTPLMDSLAGREAIRTNYHCSQLSSPVIIYEREHLSVSLSEILCL